MFEDEFNNCEKYRNRDIYIVGYKYYTACKTLVETLPIKSKIYKDVCDMCVEFEELLVLNEDSYLRYKKEIKSIEDKVLQDRPYLKEQFEEAEKQRKEQNKTISSI